MRLRMTADERWDRVGSTMFVVAGGFGLGALYGMWNRVGDAEVLMTILPGACCAGIGWLAFRQRDRILYGTPPTWVDWVVRGAALLVFVLAIFGVLGREPGADRYGDSAGVIEPGGVVQLPRDVTTRHVWMKLGGKRACTASLVRTTGLDPRRLCGPDEVPNAEELVRQQREACPPGHWKVVQHPYDPDETDELCVP